MRTSLLLALPLGLAACGDAAVTPPQDATAPVDTGSLTDATPSGDVAPDAPPDAPPDTPPDAPPDAPPESVCLTLRGAAELLPSFGRGTSAHTAINMAPDPAMDAVVLEGRVHPGAWVEDRAIPRGAHDSDGVYYDGVFYILGGQTNGIPMNEVAEASLLVSQMQPDGTLGAWSNGTPITLPERRPGIRYLGITDHLLTLHANVIYLTGGAGAGGNDIFNQFVETWYATPRGGDIAWNPGPANPVQRFGHETLVASGFLYTLGGDDGMTATDDVSFAAIRPDGTLGPFQRTTPIPDGPNQFLAGGATERRLYLTGGCRRRECLVRANIDTRVLVADVQPDGALSAWRDAGVLPVRSFDHKVIVLGGRMFVTGGRPGGFGRCGDVGGDNTRGVWWADLMPDGSLGPWQGDTTSESAFPRPRSDHFIRRDDRDRLWVLGGRTSCVGSEPAQNQNFPRTVWRSALQHDPGRARVGSWLSGPLRPTTGTPRALRWTATGTGFTARVRAALRGAPNTWTAWSEAVTTPEVAVPGDAVAVQLNVEATGDGEATPALRRVEVLCR